MFVRNLTNAGDRLREEIEKVSLPVYVGFFSSRPSFPPVISQPISQPNWKFRRLSSIDHDRFVSIRMPWSVAAIIEAIESVPGSRPTFVIRTIGIRL